MDQLACASLPAFPLQLLLRRHPAWAVHPVVVVAEDTPQGLILWVNEPARCAGVRPGLRYAAGLSLTPDLRAGVVPPAEIAEAVVALTQRLMRFTPEVEPAAEEPGVFWLNAGGLGRLYPSLGRWARAVWTDLGGAGFSAAVVVGFTRFGTYAVAKIRTGPVVLRDPRQERAIALQVPLDRLGLDPEVRDTLEALGITTVRAFLSLPAGGLLERFGPEAYRLHQMAAGALWVPLRPYPAEEPIRQTLALDDPETDRTRLLFLIKPLLHALLGALVLRGEALAELVLGLQLDGARRQEVHLRPAAPTLEAIQMLDLVRLRFETLGLAAGVVQIELTAQGVPATREQLRFFAGEARRDLDSAHQALARLRAEFGDEAVVRARLIDGHLPEASFAWEPLEQVALPRPGEAVPRALVRRILARPVPLPRRHLPPKLRGPYVVSGGWWTEAVHRDYYFAETTRGELLWVYFDRRRRRWFLQGRVE